MVIQTKFPWHRKTEPNSTKETFNIIGDEVTLTLSDNIRFDLNDSCLDMNFTMDLDRETLQGMVDFINQYLENK